MCIFAVCKQSKESMRRLGLYLLVALVLPFFGGEYNEISSADAYTTDDQDDYIPFVKEGKVWHMVASNGDECSKTQYMLMNGEVVKDGKTYFRLYEKGGEVVHDLGLLREENRKVYFLDRNNILYSNMNEEFLLFDYSLKEGDIFETYSYDEHKMVSYKVMSIGDCLAGPEIIRYDYDEASGSTITHRRYLREWTVWRTDNKYEKRWIEGIGPYEGPLKNLYDAHPISSRVYLAYVNDGSGDLYLPFSFHDSLWRLASGCNLPTGEEDHSGNDNHHQLKYELEGDRLHVYGKVFTQCGPNNYAYFIRDPENMFEESSIRKFHFEIQEVEPLADCMALHATDFYVEGFSPNYDYIIIDNQGEEHPVQVTGIEAVRNKKQELGSYIYDLQGRRIETSNLKAPTSNLKKGIYIQNGKKYVVK